MGEVESSVDFMNSKAIGIVPLLSGSGMRIKIVEGMALGKPMVTTSIGAEGNPAKDGKEVMIADHPSEFAQKILQLINDRTLFDDMSRDAIDFVNATFNNKAIAQSLIHFYKSL